MEPVSYTHLNYHTKNLSELVSKNNIKIRLLDMNIYSEVIVDNEEDVYKRQVFKRFKNSIAFSGFFEFFDIAIIEPFTDPFVI